MKIGRFLSIFPILAASLSQAAPGADGLVTEFSKITKLEIHNVDLNKSSGMADATLFYDGKTVKFKIYRDLANLVFPSPQLPIRVYVAGDVIVGVGLNNLYHVDSSKNILTFSKEWLRAKK